MSERRERLRVILRGTECVQAAAIFDPLSARLAATLGYRVGTLAGSVASAVALGAPDLALLTFIELADLVRRVSRRSDLSLVVDADHGYGDALNVMRTVEEVETAGAAAVTIEDTRLPLRSGPGEGMIEIGEMVGKLRGALRARQDDSFAVIARTRALRISGVAACVERVRAYERAGADAIALMGAKSTDELAAIHAATSLPILIGSGSASGDPALLASCGVRIASQGNLAFLAAVKASYDTLKHLREGGSAAALKDRLASEELVGLATSEAEHAAWEREFLS